MPTTLPHVRIEAVGTLGAASGNEIWSCSLKAGVAASGAPNLLIAPSDSDLNEYATIGASAWATLIGTGTQDTALFSDFVNLTEVRATSILSTGKKNPDQETAVVTVPGGQRGTATHVGSTGNPGKGNVPYQVAIVCTLQGFQFTSGAASHGRFYLPVPNIGADSTDSTYQAMTDGLMSVLTVTSFVDAVGPMLSSINSVVLSSGHLSSLQLISTSADAGGIRNQDVNTVTIDNRPDTIRRRSNKLGGAGKLSTLVTS